LSFAVVGFLIVWWLGAKGFCTYGCPYGAIFGVADRLAPGRIRVTDACEGCGHCTSVCSSNVRVHEEVAKHGMVVDPGCMKCLDCVSVCPKDALYFGFGAPKPISRSQQRIAARADFTWPEELTLALVALLAFGSFHGAWFGEPVPLLLAVGLAVITAVFSLLAVRLLRRGEMTFQHRALKLQGRLTAAGRWVLLAIAAWLLLTVDTGVVSFCSWRSEVASAAVPPREQKVPRAAGLRAIDDILATAVAFTLVDDPKLHFRRGMVQRELGATLEDVSLFASAEAELRRALALNPDFQSAIVPLTDLLNLRGATEEIEPLLLHALQLQPNDNGARVRLERLQQRRGK
jgi:ferredoxin